MRKMLFLFILFFASNIIGQTITGKLVDHNGTALSGLSLKLYMSSHVYNATSSGDGSFTFGNFVAIENNIKIPNYYAVANNYPNPFNPKTRIPFNMPEAGKVKLNVFNILGQEVIQGIQRDFTAGSNFIDVELKGLPNGIYIARIVLNNKFTASQKMVLLYGSQHLNSASVIPSFSLSNSNSYSVTLDNQKIDSIVVTGNNIKQNSYFNMPDYTGSSMSLGNLVVNIKTTGIPCPGMPTIKYAGWVYNTVLIGTQCWLSENLNVGQMIQGSQDQTDNSIIEKYCYNNDTTNCRIYGGLYQWAEAVQYLNGASNTSSPNPAFSGNVQGICPTGWHLPSQDEIKTLGAATFNYSMPNMMAIGQGFGQLYGTDTFGFSGLFSGYRNATGNFTAMNLSMWILCITEKDSNNAIYPYFSYSMSFYLFQNINKTLGKMCVV